jgi:hypothetical protein
LDFIALVYIVIIKVMDIKMEPFGTHLADLTQMIRYPHVATDPHCNNLDEHDTLGHP